MSNIEELIKKFEPTGEVKVKRSVSLRNPGPVLGDAAALSDFGSSGYDKASVFEPVTTTNNTNIADTDTCDSQKTERSLDHSQATKKSDHCTLHESDAASLTQTPKRDTLSAANASKHPVSKRTSLPCSVSIDRLEDLGYASKQHANVRGTHDTDNKRSNNEHQSANQSKPEREKRVSAPAQESSVYRTDPSIGGIRPKPVRGKSILYPVISDNEGRTSSRGECSDQDTHKEPGVERGTKFKSFFKEIAHVIRPKKKYKIEKTRASTTSSVEPLSIKNTREGTKSESSNRSSVRTSTTSTVNATAASQGQDPDYSLPTPLPEPKALKGHCIQSFKKINSNDSMMTGIRSIGGLDYQHQTVTAINELILHAMDEITSEMDPQFRGVSIGIGSFYDKTKVTDPDEFDFLYELRNISFDCVPAEQDFCYKVVLDPKVSNEFFDVCEEYEGHTVLTSDKLHAAFAEAITKALDGITLPEKRLQHAGFRSPRFSGVRKSGPAVTILFNYLNDNGKTFIKVDITPALPVAVKGIDDIEWPPVVANYLRKTDAVKSIHLIPGERRQTWKLSTANLELDFMKVELKDDGKVRRTIRIVKGLHHKHLAVRGAEEEEERKRTTNNATAMTKKHIREGTLSKIANMLDKERKIRDLLLFHQSCKDLVASDKGGKSAEIKRVMEDTGDRLQGSMLYGWSEIDPITLSLTNEIDQPYIATKSCAVKYVVLDKLFKGSLQDADHSGPRPSEIREVMEGSTKEVVTHALLKNPIKAKQTSLFAKKSVPRVKGSHWVDLHNEVCSQFLAKLQDLDVTKPVTNDHKSPKLRRNSYNWEEDRNSMSSDRASQETYSVTEDFNATLEAGHPLSGRRRISSESLQRESVYDRNIQRQSSQQMPGNCSTVRVVCVHCQGLNVLQQLQTYPATADVEMGTPRMGRHDKRSDLAKVRSHSTERERSIADENASSRRMKKSKSFNDGMAGAQASRRRTPLTPLLGRGVGTVNNSKGAYQGYSQTWGDSNL